MYKKILVPLDGSDLAECAIQHTKAIAAGCNVPQVILLSVVENIAAGAGPDFGAPAQSGTQGVQEKWGEKEQAGLGKQYLDKRVAELKKQGVDAQAVIIKGKAAEDILDYAKKNQVDLIIMSTHGRSGISRWAMGSVADRVMRHSTVPVLLITPTGCRVDV